MKNLPSGQDWFGQSPLYIVLDLAAGLLSTPLASSSFAFVGEKRTSPGHDPKTACAFRITEFSLLPQPLAAVSAK